VKLYDSASAVVAELVANSYDADAENVWVRLPLSRVLSSGSDAEQAADLIEVEDDGHGMTPTEAIDFFLDVGRDRRVHGDQGPRSRERDRPVMGRKGIGKLAPFGICRTIEVLSSGGERQDAGYLTTHFRLEFDQIVKDTDERVELPPGPEDRTFRPKRGTVIRLSDFLRKRVPDEETFHRQLARRFVFARPDFHVLVEDLRDENATAVQLDPLAVPIMEGTRIDVSTRPVPGPDGDSLPIQGWLGLAKEAYKNEEMAGVRIYARGKIVATTRDFEQPAGFTGEFTMRSYLVGQLEAEWLDQDDGDDLVRTDRQGILWTSEYGVALREWGASIIKEIAARGREPRRVRVRDRFLTRSDLAGRARARYADEDVVRVAIALGEQIGGFAAEDELEDDDYVNGLCEVILSVAPHQALIEAFQQFSERIGGEPAPIADLLQLFTKTRVAEMASYSQIAAERVRVLRELEGAVFAGSLEGDLQSLLARAPWLIEPTWSVITTNQTLKTFKTAFEKHWKDRTGETITLAIDESTVRPDFTLINVGQQLHVVEIKAADHTFSDDDFERLSRYVTALDEFFAANLGFRAEFPLGYVVDLVCKDVALRESNNRIAFESLVGSRRIIHMSWVDFLGRAKRAHEAFLEIADRSGL
jgi:hypothetical protein